MTSTVSRPRHYASRGVTHSRPYVRPGTPLPARETFTGHDDLLAAYDEFLALDAAQRTRKADSVRLRTEAKAAEQSHSADLRAAMASGKSAPKNRAPELLEEAERAERMAAEAKQGTTAVGHTLGELIAQAAPSLYDDLDKEMSAAAEEVEAVADQLTTAWTRWDAAWHLRLLLSRSEIIGGNLTPHQTTTGPPAAVTAALAAFKSEAGKLDELKNDERVIQEWRRAN